MHYVAEYSGITWTERYAFQRPHDELAKREAVRYHLKWYYIEPIANNPPFQTIEPGRGKLMPISPCRRSFLVGTLDKLFEELPGGERRILKRA